MIPGKSPLARFTAGENALTVGNVKPAAAAWPTTGAKHGREDVNVVRQNIGAWLSWPKPEREACHPLRVRQLPSEEAAVEPCPDCDGD